MKTSRRVDSPSISWNYSTPKTRGGNWCSSWTFWWYCGMIEWKPVILYLFPSKTRWYFVQRIIFFCLSSFQGYDRFAIRNFTRGLVMPNVIKWRFSIFEILYIFHEKLLFCSKNEAVVAPGAQKSHFLRQNNNFFMKKIYNFKNRKPSLYNIWRN